MYAGRIVEVGPVAEVVRRAKHPYTIGLMGSIPLVGYDVQTLTQIDGTMPRLDAIPAGCAFNPRCPQAFARCRQQRPELAPVEPTDAACWPFRDGGRRHDCTAAGRQGGRGLAFGRSRVSPRAPHRPPAPSEPPPAKY